MGVEAVAYHEATVVGRADDHEGQALDYYGTRGETPLRWGGSGAERLGLSGEVTADAYRAAFGPGGFVDPILGDRLAATQRPGFELVVSAHKSVAVLGVIGRADDMHSILDTETDATLEWLDSWFQQRGGRRGRAQVRTRTSGLTYATTRHGTSRDGDPGPHDHVLVANVVEMLDTNGGFKGLDSASLRDTTVTATMVGRLASAARAVELGYAIEPDVGPSGRLRHWRIAGIPRAVCDLFSKRADEISEYLAESGYDSPRARAVAARKTRTVKRHTGVDELLPGWIAELETLGWSVERLSAALTRARERSRGRAEPLSVVQIDALTASVLDIDGDLLRDRKVFTRTRLIAEVAPRLYGSAPDQLDRVIDRMLASRSIVPLIGVVGAHEQAYTTAQILAVEEAIAATIETLIDRDGRAVADAVIDEAIEHKEAELGHAMTDGQHAAVRHICSSDRGAAVVIGVAGSGKTTALDAATNALTTAGFSVIGTAISGQAARTLGREADIDSRTVASLLARLDRGRLTLDKRTVVILDEASMTADADLYRLVLGIARASASLVLVGDPRQLSSVGPGGALDAVLDRHPDIVTTLADNVRQHDPDERAALEQLRAGSIDRAVAWYARAGRTAIAPNRNEALAGMVDAWAGDIAAGHDTALLAWRRNDVADLNRLARAKADQTNRLRGPDLIAPGGRAYAAGDIVVALQPIPDAGMVTSQGGTVVAVDRDSPSLIIDTGDRQVCLADEQIDEDHLDHGYATTVHRAQGATYDRAHVFADGGGRELGYVAMSRARDCTTLHAVADTTHQALKAIRTDWAIDRHQRWVTQTAAAAPAGVRARPVDIDREARRGRLQDERQRLVDLAPPEPSTEIVEAIGRVNALRSSIGDLKVGLGEWRDTGEGRAGLELIHAHSQQRQAEELANSTSGRIRRHWKHTAQDWGAQADRLQARWDQSVQPVVNELTAHLEQAERIVEQLRFQRHRYDQWFNEHPYVRDRVLDIERTLEADRVAQRLEQFASMRQPDRGLGVGF